jgi:hypothetical protein
MANELFKKKEKKKKKKGSSICGDNFYISVYTLNGPGAIDFLLYFIL